MQRPPVGCDDRAVSRRFLLSPLDAALLRLGRAALAVLHPSLAERARLADGEEAARAAAEVDRLALMLAL